MENKINIAELLKDCPRGMELDCVLFDNVTLLRVDNYEGIIYPIILTREDGNLVTLTKYGQFSTANSAKCLIFPKGKTTWEGFIPPCKFKDGDILFVKAAYSWIIIYKESKNTGDFYKYVGIPDYPNYTFMVYDCNPLCCKDDISETRLATEEEKKKLFDAIKANGYHWNEETKSLEKLVESNEDVDDKIVMSGIYFDRENYADEVELYLGNYEIEVRNGKTYAVFKNQETKISKPIFKVGDKIKHKDTVLTIITVQTNNYIVEDEPDNFGLLMFSQQDKWELIPNKFDINTLVPFESRVLVRSSMDGLWKPAVFGFRNGYNDNAFYIVGGSCWKQCIPYEGNEHLLGKTEDCDEYFKIWQV